MVPQQFPPGGNRPLKSPRLDALKVEVAPQFHHGTASPGTGGNRCPPSVRAVRVCPTIRMLSMGCSGRQPFPPGGNRRLQSPRLDALNVEIAPQFHHGMASSGRWRESLTGRPPQGNADNRTTSPWAVMHSPTCRVLPESKVPDGPRNSASAAEPRSFEYRSSARATAAWDCTPGCVRPGGGLPRRAREQRSRPGPSRPPPGTPPACARATPPGLPIRSNDVSMHEIYSDLSRFDGLMLHSCPHMIGVREEFA